MSSDPNKSTINRVLLISVCFYDDWYYGAGDWPPTPARLFQALVSGVAIGGKLADEDKIALEWLETLEAPVIVAPIARQGQAFKNYVPNNDLDSVGNNPKRVAEIRTGKSIRPHIFDSRIPLLFAWRFNGGGSTEDKALGICNISQRLYQLGRGVDMAWAYADLFEANDIDLSLARNGCAVHHPSENSSHKGLLIPQKGSLESLERRFKMNQSRFTLIKRKKKNEVCFSLAPPPRFAKVAYNALPRHFLFEIRSVPNEESFLALPYTRAGKLVVNLRDKAVGRLQKALHGKADTINRVLIGREATEADKSARVRIIPIPSIGHSHADRAIRRVLVEVPPNCPLKADDIDWAFSGVEDVSPATGEVIWNLVHAKDRGMLNHYGIEDNEQNDFRIWRTITPVVLPFIYTAHRIAGTKRLKYETKTVRAVMQALRHAGVTIPVESIRIQREPFDRKGARAEEFSMAERFTGRGLHHVEIVFRQPLHGPLVIGNGRYLGLGLMAPKVDL